MSRLASLIADRFVLAWIAGAAIWLGYVLSLALGGWSHDAAGHRVGADHVQYYVVGQLVNDGDAALIYDEATTKPRQKDVGGDGWQGYLPFRYPPFYALAFAPTSRLGYEASFLVWTAISFGCLLLSGRLLGVGWRTWLLWSLCFYPVFAAFSYGQNGLISLCVLSAAAALWLRDRPLLAGLVLGLLAFKPHLALGVGFLWMFDFRRSWRGLLGIVVTTGVLLLIGWLAIPQAYQAFFRSAGGNVSMLEQGRAGLAPLYCSQGSWQLLLSERFDGVANPLTLLTSGLGLGAFFLLWWRWRDRRMAAFALAVLVTPWLTPYAMVYDWSILLVAAVLLSGRGGVITAGEPGANTTALGDGEIRPAINGRPTETSPVNRAEDRSIPSDDRLCPAGFTRLVSVGRPFMAGRIAAVQRWSANAPGSPVPASHDRWLALCGILWLVALVSLPLVRGQLWLSERLFVPVAVQVAFPAIVFAVLALWNPDRGAVEQPPPQTS